ncbi:MAG: hypothetical protein AUI11_13140 [Acidobacteria bacterium 13_2_20CM_2_66_4]|nr:MAG: hypothetical protein AUI11_13140 [Acidobacteria bacterium 13_2_20CM_2_66_4]PYQ77739.1 MAG: hypothetical protein DMG01_13815 [Acidobacteriota bacterium]
MSIVLLGTQFYRGAADAMRRQQQAADALVSLRGAAPVNLQWRPGAGEDVCERPGVETLAVLTEDARRVSGLPGRCKPIVPEMLDALADAAATRGLRYFALFNGDIVVTERAIDRILSGGKQTYAFSRMNLDESGRSIGLTLQGIDMLAYDAAWWRRNRARFRPYILGEPCFDVVFTAVMMCHGDGIICNRDGEIRHEDHPNHPFGAHADYNHYLAALDAPYFSLWVKYWDALVRARKRGASEAEERALLRESFVWQPTVAAALWHAGRCARARWRYRRRVKHAVAERAAR